MVVIALALPVRAQVGSISVRAKGSQVQEGDIRRATEEVVIAYQDVRIQCDEVELNTITGDVHAVGNVIIDRGPERLTADEMFYNLQTKTGSFTNVSGMAEPSFSFTGALLEQIDETHYRILDGTFTSCEQKERPPWDLHLREALVEDEGYGRFKGVAFRIKKVPTLYLPYLWWPMKMERAAGLLAPALGYSDRRGFYLGTQLFVPFGRSYDTTIRLDYFSEGFYGLGTQFRWAPVKGAYGEITPYVMRDPEAGVWQWKVDGRHRQEDFLGYRMLAEVHALSDDDFFREFESEFQQNTRRSLYSQIFLTRSRGPATHNIRFDRRETFLQSNDVVLHQLPEVEYRVRSNRIGQTSLYWSMISSANFFEVDRGGDLTGSYGRLDVFPELSYTIPGPPWLAVTPVVGGRATWYSQRYAENRQSFVEEPIWRNYLHAGLDIVGPSFSRIFTTNNARGTRFKHLIQPRIEYNFFTDPDEDVGFIPIFDEVDTTPQVNRMTVTLSNNLYMRTRDSLGAREIVTFDLFQDYSFDDPLSYGSDGMTSQKGPFGAALRVVPVEGSTIDARVTFDAITKTLRTTSLSASTYRPAYTAGVTWYESFSSITGDRTSSQMQVRLGLRKPDFPLTADVHVAYDIEQSLLQQQRYAMGYEGSCWGIRAEWRDVRSLFPVREYRIVISLKDIGELPAIKGTLTGSGM